LRIGQQAPVFFLVAILKYGSTNVNPYKKSALRVSKAMARTVERIEEDIALEEALSTRRRNEQLTVVI